MANLIAIDWDSHELRAVTARASSGGITVTDTATVPLANDEPSTVSESLNGLLDKLGGRGKYRLIVAIGRGKAELRQLTLPPVPENELPDIVRLQAMQSFSTSGDAVAVDYLPVESSESSTSVIAAGVAPATMKQISELAENVSLDLKRVVLRPVAAAALYGLKADHPSGGPGDCVLVDMLADDAEILVFRDNKIIFVRSVRLPEQSQGRLRQVSGEIRRSLMACGTDASGSGYRVVIWGQAETHEEDSRQLRELLKCDVQTLDPLELVDVDSRVRNSGAEYAAGTHTGRLAPLIGVLAADAAAEASSGQSPYLVDFVNPRKTIEVKQDYRLLIGAGVAAALLLLFIGYSVWSNFRTLNNEIADRRAELNRLQPKVEEAEESIARTERVDQFLDRNVIWLDQFRRLAERMPPSEEVVLTNITAGASQAREGGGTMTLSGTAVSSAAVKQMEAALRDEMHSVIGGGTAERADSGGYRWGFNKTVVTVPGEFVRDHRYETLLGEAEEADADDAGDEGEAESEAEPDSELMPEAGG